MILLPNPANQLLLKSRPAAGDCRNLLGVLGERLDPSSRKGEANMKATYRNLQILATSVILLASVSLVAQQKMPETTNESIPGKATVTTEKLQGTVEYVEGNHLVVRMTDGDVYAFDPPANRTFTIDGKELTIRDLKPGTMLTATVITTTTPIIDRIRTVGTAKVFWVSGRTVVLTLPNGENRTYKVKEDYKFTVRGKPADVSELRTGMQISAEKIVEEPRTEIVSNTTVTGHAPR